MTLKEVKGSKRPAIFMKRYDTRKLYYDGKDFYAIYDYVLTMFNNGTYTERLTIVRGDSILPDLPEDGWRKGYGNLDVESVHV